MEEEMAKVRATQMAQLDELIAKKFGRTRLTRNKMKMMQFSRKRREAQKVSKMKTKMTKVKSWKMNKSG